MIFRSILTFFLVLLVAPILFGQVNFDPPFGDNEQYDFPDTPVGEQSIIMLNVQNNGNQQCQVMLHRPAPPFSIDNGNLILQAGEAGAIAISFTPQEAGDFRADLGGTLAISIFLSDMGTVTLTGTGTEDNPQPIITVDPEQIQVAVNENNGPVEETLLIGNVGDADLIGDIVAPELAWLSVDPLEFNIEAGDERNITLTFGDNWPNNGDYEASIIVNSNDPENEAIEIPIRASIDFPRFVDRVIQLREGWSMISSNIDFAPDFEDDEGPDIRLILNEIVDHVLTIKDGDGTFCAPPFNFWGIQQWETPRGYLIKVDEETELTVNGVPIPFDRQIDLHQGWNMIAYYPTYDLEFGNAFAELVELDQLLILKNARGEFLIPEFNFGWNFIIEPGEGLLVKVTEDCSFQYPPEPE